LIIAIFVYAIPTVDLSGGTPCDINVMYTPLKNTFNGLIILSLTMRVYLHSFSRSCLPNMRNHAKFWKKSDL